MIQYNISAAQLEMYGKRWSTKMTRHIIKIITTIIIYQPNTGFLLLLSLFLYKDNASGSTTVNEWSSYYFNQKWWVTRWSFPNSIFIPEHILMYWSFFWVKFLSSLLLLFSFSLLSDSHSCLKKKKNGRYDVINENHHKSQKRYTTIRIFLFFFSFSFFLISFFVLFS